MLNLAYAVVAKMHLQAALGPEVVTTAVLADNQLVTGHVGGQIGRCVFTYLLINSRDIGEVGLSNL